MNNILEVKNVVKQYGDYTALNNVSLQVPKGSIYGLLGPNGAGKTSLIRIINQITMPDKGTVLLDGEPLNLAHVKDIGAVNGKVRIKLEEGIQSGKILRLKGKGIPSINGYGNGDLLVHVNVWTPKNLNKEQKQFFEKSLTDENFIPNPEKSEKSFFEKVKDMFS